MSEEILVQFRPGISRLERRRAVEALGCRLRKEIEAQRIAVAVLPTGSDPAQMVRRFLAMEGVAYAEADQPVQANSERGDLR